MFAMQHDGYRERIRICRTADLGAFVPWFAGAMVAGRVHRDREPLLAGDPSFHRDGERLQVVGEDFAARSRALAEAIDRLHRRGEVRAPLGEMYGVPGPGGGPPLLQVDRAAVAWFGVQATGVHLNGFVRDRGVHLWVAERARGKRTFPGHLDNVVAGGRPIGLSAMATLVKECGEEAAIPPELAARAVPVGTIDYAQQDGLSLKVDSLACFDLELPADFVPTPHDGEVEGFRLWPVDEVAASLRNGGTWKPNSAMVALDFLLRLGLLDGELPVAERAHLWQQLRCGLP